MKRGCGGYLLDDNNTNNGNNTGNSYIDNRNSYKKKIVIVIIIMLRENSDLRGTVSCGWQPEQGRAVGKTARIWKSVT